MRKFRNVYLLELNFPFSVTTSSSSSSLTSSRWLAWPSATLEWVRSRSSFGMFNALNVKTCIVDVKDDII